MKKATTKKSAKKTTPRSSNKLRLTKSAVRTQRRLAPEIEIAGEGFLRYLKQNHKERHFETPANIIYEGHVPLAAYLVCDGTLDFFRGKRHIKTIDMPHIIVGASELFHKSAYPFTVQVKTQTRVYILSRTILLDAIEHGFLGHLKKLLKHQIQVNHKKAQ